MNGQYTVCSAGSPETTTIGTGNAPGNDDRTVVVKKGALINTQDASAISLADRANITVKSGGTVSNHAVELHGFYGTGTNTIEFQNNGTLTVEAGGKVLSKGTEDIAEAVNLQGTGNVITNSGLIQAKNAAASGFRTRRAATRSSTRRRA